MLTLHDLVLKFILLDWDGTLIDTTEPGIDLVEIIALSRGLPFTGETREYLRRTWGKPGYLLLADAFEISEDEGHSFYKDWCALEAKVQLEEGKCLLYPGTVPTLQDFRERGKLLGLNTSRPGDSIEAVTLRMNVRKHFEHIAYRGLTEFHKPDPRSMEPSLAHFATMGFTKENCVWVGDTPADVEVGIAAGLVTFAVQTGCFLYEEPKGLHSDFVINTVADLIPRMRDLGWRS